MVAEEHDRTNIGCDGSQKASQLSINHDSVKLLVRNTYWTKDYMTGIKLFIRHMKGQKDLLSKDIAFYSDFSDKFWKPSLNNLQKLEPTNSINKQLLASMRERFSIISTDQIESDCKIPLQELRDHSESFLREAENDLSSRYSVYAKDLIKVKESLNECEKKIRYIYKLKKVKTSIKDPLDISNGKNDGDGTSVFGLEFACEFPYALDARLKFDNSEQFMSFLLDLKGSVKVEKSMFPVPGLPNESFEGQSLFKELKKLEPKLDLSLFNIDRMGNEFIHLGIIKGYFLSFYSSKNSRFDLQKYYYWDCEIFNKHKIIYDATPRTKKAYGDLTPTDNKHEENLSVSSIKTSISDWIRKVSLQDDDDGDVTGGEDINENDWKSFKQQLSSLQDNFFSRCCQLEYSKVQLEKTIYDYCKNYSKMDDEIKQSLALSNKIFHQRCEQFTKRPVCSSREEDPCQKKDDITGFFLRDNGIPFRKWNILELNDPMDACKEISIKREKFFCGSEICDDMTFTDTLETIKIILRQIEKEPNAGKITQSWHNDIDFIRISNLKRDLLGKFKESKTFQNTNSIITAQFLEKSHTYVTNDFVGLIKLWLLELPDSLVPSSHYDILVKAEEPLIPLCEQFSTSSLRFLHELARHFQLLNAESSLPPQTVRNLFVDYSDIDIPLAHHFIRRTGLQSPMDIKILSPALYTFFINQDTLKTLQRLVDNDTTATPTPTALTDPPTIIIKDTAPLSSSTSNPPPNNHDGPFIPRPFKTSSIPTTPEKPRRKSGLFLPINVNDRPSI